MFASIFVVVGFVGLVAFVANEVSKYFERIGKIKRVLLLLGSPEPVLRAGRVNGRIAGLDVSYMVHKGRNNGTYMTRCRVTLPPDLPQFEMDLRRQTAGSVREVEHGRAIDVVLGDEAFDDAFLVEAAPSAVAREILDEVARTNLLTFEPCRMRLDGAELCFEKPDRLDEPAEIRRVLEMCVRIVARLQSLRGELREKRLAAAAHVEGNEGYRGPAPDALARVDHDPRGTEEILALHRARATRRKRDAILVSVGVAIGIAIGVARGCTLP